MSETYSLTELIERLEAVTVRLENLSCTFASGIISDTLSTILTLDQPAVKVPRVVEQHDLAINISLERYMNLSHSLGGLISEQARYVKQAVNAERDIIYISTLSQKPDRNSSTYMKLLETIHKALSKIIDMKDTHRHDPFFNHLSTVAEGIPALGWFTCDPTPVPFIRGMKEATQFYSNRVIKDWKEKDLKHVEWTKAFLELLDNLAIYVKDEFPTGLVWCIHGDPPETFIGKSFI